MDTSSYQEYIDRLRDEVLHQHGATAAEKFSRVVKLVKVLRDRCPWDRKQTPESLAHLLLEESYELVHAIDAHDDQELRKELGDLFFTLRSRQSLQKKQAHSRSRTCSMRSAKN